MKVNLSHLMLFVSYTQFMTVILL